MSDRRHQERLVVVPYRPGEVLRRRLFTWLAILVTAGVFLGLGYIYTQIETRSLREENRQLRLQLETAHERAEKTANELIVLQRERAVDRVASSEASEMLADMQKQVRQMRQDITFYRDIMAPSDKAEGLQVKELGVKSVAGDRRYAYKLVLTQVNDNRRYIEGVVAVNLIGQLDGEQQVLPLRDLSGTEDLGMRFRFRYFQNLEGELTLPESFAPEKIQVVAQAKGKKTTKIERTFNWEAGA